MRKLTPLLAVAVLVMAALACGSDPISIPTPGEVEAIPLTASIPEPPAGEELASVTRIVDGDTIEVSMNDVTYRVRYIGINTPEVGQPCADEATAFNTLLVSNQVVRMVKDVSETDRFGRLLRYVYVGDLFVNAELVAQGYAQAATYPPDVAYAALFVQLEAEARAAGRGCWAATED